MNLVIFVWCDPNMTQWWELINWQSVTFELMHVASSNESILFSHELEFEIYTFRDYRLEMESNNRKTCGMWCRRLAFANVFRRLPMSSISPCSAFSISFEIKTKSTSPQLQTAGDREYWQFKCLFSLYLQNIYRSSDRFEWIWNYNTPITSSKWNKIRLAAAVAGCVRVLYGASIFGDEMRVSASRCRVSRCVHLSCFIRFRLYRCWRHHRRSRPSSSSTFPHLFFGSPLLFFSPSIE